MHIILVACQKIVQKFEWNRFRMKAVKKIFTFWKRGAKSEEVLGQMPPDMARGIPWVQRSAESSASNNGDDEATDTDVESNPRPQVPQEENADFLELDVFETIYPASGENWRFFESYDTGELNEDGTHRFERQHDNLEDDDHDHEDEILNMSFNAGSNEDLKSTQNQSYLHPGPVASADKGLMHIPDQLRFQGTVSQAKILGLVRPSTQLHKFEGYGLFGLTNIGNTCYMNSVLQCLSNTKPFIESILGGRLKAAINSKHKVMPKKLLVECLEELMISVWKKEATSPANYVIGDPTQLKLAIETKTPMFKDNGQHDAHEFLRYFLDGIHSELNKAIPNKSISDEDEVSGSDGETVAERNPIKDKQEYSNETENDGELAWLKYLLTDNSVVVDDFVGQLKSTLTCSKCGYESVKYEAFWDLSLPIPSPTVVEVHETKASKFTRSKIITLEECLQLLLEENSLDQEGQCQHCKMMQKSLKKLEIAQFPRIIVIHLKRFSSESKLTTPVQFPLYGLEMKGHASTIVTGGVSYNLYGVVNHMGSTNIGHYIAYCKHPFNYFKDWFRYDDTDVSIVDHKVVSGCTSDAYLLLYEMCTASRDILGI